MSRPSSLARSTASSASHPAAHSAILGREPPLPQFESEFEQDLYRQRQQKLEQLQEIGQRLGLSPLESIYPNRFPAADEALPLAQIPELLERYDDPATPVTAEQFEQQSVEIAVAGRLMSLRLQGKAGFAHLQGGGKRLQIYIRKDDVGEDIFALYKLLDLGDHIGVRGHLMRTRTGELTLKATPVNAPDGQPRPAISFLAKAMLALPDKYHGLEDVELRYRQRYVDLIMNSGTLTKAEAAPSSKSGAPSSPAASSLAKVGSELSSPNGLSSRSAAEGSAPLPPGTSAVTDTALASEEHNDAPLNVREVFVKRAAILRAIRKFLDTRGYLEVETPMLHTVAGGAAARPFKTHHNALDIPLSLRIAPELFLKRLVVGGLDRVYEINRNFRNEGVSTRHNPEFTMLEFYQAYANYHDLMDLTQELIQFVATEVNGTTETHFNGHGIDLGIWKRLRMVEALREFWPEGFVPPPTTEQLRNENSFRPWFADFLQSINVPDEGTDDELEAPRQLLAAKIRGMFRDGFGVRINDPRIQVLSERDPAGKSIATLFEIVAEEHLIQPTIIYDFPLAVSPLSKVKPNEPDWVERFEFYIGGFEVGNAFSELNDPIDQEQRFQAQVADKDPESMASMDEDYVRALGYGLPPTAGEGIGIDRLTMLLTGSRSIRDVILFPLMRPRSENPDAADEATALHHGESAE